MFGLERARELGSHESGLAVVVIAHRQDGSPYVSVVNAGVVDHPVAGGPVVGFVARGGTRKLPNLRVHPRVTVVFRSGWDWVAVEGDAELAGPHDPLHGFAMTDLPGCSVRSMPRPPEGAPTTSRSWTLSWLRRVTQPFWFDRFDAIPAPPKGGRRRMSRRCLCP